MSRDIFNSPNLLSFYVTHDFLSEIAIFDFFFLRDKRRGEEVSSTVEFATANQWGNEIESLTHQQFSKEVWN